MPDRDTGAILDALVEQLTRRTWRMATAESCTGGWVAKVCTDRAGSSNWFDRGYVTYSNQAKVDVLGVDPAGLGRYGAVSAGTARQMAEGARRVAGVDVALAVTGIAGPDGGTADKPVGTVWFAWSCGDRPAVVQRQLFDGDRDAVRRQSVAFALRGLVAALRD